MIDIPAPWSFDGNTICSEWVEKQDNKLHRHIIAEINKGEEDAVYNGLILSHAPILLLTMYQAVKWYRSIGDGEKAPLWYEVATHVIEDLENKKGELK